MSVAELLHLDWRAPHFGWLALTPLALWGMARLRPPSWRRYAEAALLPWAVRHAAMDRPTLWRGVHAVTLWALIACALAGPRLPLVMQDAGQRQALHDMDLVLAIDVSASMAADDVAPTRLARARLKILDLLPRLKGERVGLMAYAGEAGWMLPFTRDLDAVREILPLADERLFEDAGTHLAAVLTVALETFERRPQRSGALVLLTDAEAGSLSGTAGEAAFAAAQGYARHRIPIYVLAIASANGATLPGGERSVADPDGYAELVRASGGKVVTITDGEADLTALYDRGVLTLPGSRATAQTTQRWRELFAYPAGAALAVLLLPYLRPQRRALGLGVAAALAAGPVQANEALWRQAHAAFVQQRYVAAQQAYRHVDGYVGRMGEGASAYRRKDYRHAIEQFTLAALAAPDAARRADALYNLGNALYYAGALPAAADAFEATLRLRPQDPRARTNLARTQSALAAQRAQAPPVQTGIPGRRGRALGEAATDMDAAMGIEAETEATRPLVEPGRDGAAAATRLGGVSPPGGATAGADARAALAKLQLLRDQRAAVLKESLKQGARRARPEGLAPW